MELDFFTLLAVGAFDLCAITLGLPWIVGRTSNPAVQRAQWSVSLQTTAVLSLVSSTFVAGQWADWLLTAASLALSIGGLWILMLALERWLGPRRGARLLLVLLVVAPAGYLLGHQSYAFRVGWSNACVALAYLWTCLSIWWPRTQQPLRSYWRPLLSLSLMPIALVMIGRGLLGTLTSLYPSFQTPHPVNLAFAVLILFGAIWGAMALLAAWRDETEHQMHEWAQTDVLTMLPNRRGFESQAQAMLSLAKEQQTPLSLVMLDLDHFKHVNDTYGHATGDQTLTLFARVLRQACRNADLAARLGGEEFCLLLPASAHVAAMLDQRLRLLLNACAREELGFEVTFSAGMTTLQSPQDTLADLLMRADRALYDAKATGRNRLCSRPSLHMASACPHSEAAPLSLLDSTPV